MRRFRHDPRDGEAGAVLVMAAALIVAMIAAAAIMVDLGSTRNDRSENKLAADAAATSGAHALALGDGRDGCAIALSYLELHLGQALGGAACGGFPTACGDGTSSVSTTGVTASGVSATIRHPVDDADPMMTSSTAVGTPAQASSEKDGDRCLRLGVSITEDRAVLFGGVAGTAPSTTTVHSVALASQGGPGAKIINMLLLHPTDCGVVAANGGGTIVVKGVVDPVTGERARGLLSSDSDGTTNCGSNGVLDADGSGTVIRADGEPGCAGELAAGTGEGCGIIETFVPNAPDCAFPACSGNGTIGPAPRTAPFRLTRAQIDYRFNCKASYPPEVGIKPCPDASLSSAYIDDLVSTVGTFGPPAGYQDFRDLYGCNFKESDGLVEIPAGNWWVSCNKVTVKNELVFEGGNIVFDGDVSVESHGTLRVNTANPETYDWAEGTALDIYEHSAGAAIVFLRDGQLSRNAQASIEMLNTFTYISSDSSIDMGGGGGSTNWVAPTEGPFRNLAVWSDSSSDLEFAGGAGLGLEGVFFLPYSAVNYQGSGNQEQVAAQFIAERLIAGGNGTLIIEPIFSRLVTFPAAATSELIR